MIRPATLKDLDKLVDLENAGFSGDRISKRSYRHLLSRGHAIILVDEQNGIIRASCVVLFRRGFTQARLYSFVVAPGYRGQGLGKALMVALENYVVDKGYTAISLEVREDNPQAIGLYQSHSYEIVGLYESYYTDKTHAIRMRKRLSHGY